MASRKAPKKKSPAKKSPAKTSPAKTSPAKTIQNAALAKHVFLADMLADAYFPKHLVKKGQDLLIALALRIEQERPEGEAVYALTHETTEAFNALEAEFDEAGSELETAARDAIGGDVGFILESLGYEVDVEEAIAPREW